jgi:hypothetical protein
MKDYLPRAYNVALSLDGLGSISWHSIYFFGLLHSFLHLSPRISNFFCLSTTEDTWVVEMRIWVSKLVSY